MVLVTAALFAPKLGGQLKGGGFEGSGRDSELAKDLMVEEFGLPRANLAIVFESDKLSARSEEYQRAEDEALEPLRNMEEIRSVTTYADTKDQRFLSEDGNKTYALVGFDVSVDETQSLVDEVRRKVRSDELTTYVTGPSAVYLDITNASAEDIRRAEKYAFPLALVILVIAFGTLVAAGIPILIGGNGPKGQRAAVRHARDSSATSARTTAPRLLDASDPRGPFCSPAAGASARR